MEETEIKKYFYPPTVRRLEDDSPANTEDYRAEYELVEYRLDIAQKRMSVKKRPYKKTSL